MTEHFHIGVTADFKTGIPGRIEPILQAMIDPLPTVSYTFFEPSGQDERGKIVQPSDIANFDGVLAFAPRFTAASFVGNNRLAVISRWGVGYDLIDVPACTAADVLLAITTDAVRRPVAEAIVTLLHALSMRLFEKDRLVRQGRWHERSAVPSVGLRGKTLGSVGLGNIGSEMFRLLEPFGLARKLAADPYANQAQATALGVEMVDLPTLFRTSDFIALNCPLNSETRGLVDHQLLGLMKPTAYLINTARGPIVNQGALLTALQSGQIAGAGLDVFEAEPLPADHPLTELDNVILAPHALAWNDELYHDTGATACQNILSVLRGEPPKDTVNKAVLERASFQAKLARLRAKSVTIDG